MAKDSCSLRMAPCHDFFFGNFHREVQTNWGAGIWATGIKNWAIEQGRWPESGTILGRFSYESGNWVWWDQLADAYWKKKVIMSIYQAVFGL